MIPIDFAYYKPDNLKEAVDLYFKLSEDGTPLYYSGGSEIITMSRIGSIAPTAVIDIKSIPECMEFGFSGDKLVIGSAVTLSQINESNYFPLMGTTVARIADHTNQCRITVGGNVCGTIIYREAILPLLLTDCEIIIYGSNGLKTVSIHDVFCKRMNLNKGELVVQFLVGKEYLNLPYFHAKKTKNEKIDYPLFTLCALQKDGKFRAAFSGLCDFPFRSTNIENILNDTILPEEKLDKVCSQLPSPPINNIAGSGEYRLFVLKNTIKNMFLRNGI